ncbi:MAG: hypothetical protein V1729_02880 [Candidatus Woesearchaeota archaeon]
MAHYDKAIYVALAASLIAGASLVPSDAYAKKPKGKAKEKSAAQQLVDDRKAEREAAPEYDDSDSQRPYHATRMDDDGEEQIVQDLDDVLAYHWSKQTDRKPCDCNSQDMCTAEPVNLVSEGSRKTRNGYTFNVETHCLNGGVHYVFVLDINGIEQYRDAGMNGKMSESLFSTIPGMYSFKGKKVNIDSLKNGKLKQMDKGYESAFKKLASIVRNHRR